MRSNVALMNQRRPSGPDRYDIRGSRSVRSVWVWRGFLMMSLIAAGITIILASNGATNFAVMWGVITAGWFGVAMYLWRIHSQVEQEEYERQQALKKRR